jgi:hypothetical protein
MQATIKAIRTVLARVSECGGIDGYGELLCGFGVSQKLLGSEMLFHLETKYMSSLAASDPS